MIFITLGTQDKSFTRLLDKISELMDKKIITDEVIVQAGYTKYNNPQMQLFDLISNKEFEQLIEQCDVLITHGGVGSILAGIKHNKKVIAVARQAKYNEHTNNHQIQIVEEFGALGYILPVINLDTLEEIYQKVDQFVPKPYQSNNVTFVNYLLDYIKNN